MPDMRGLKSRIKSIENIAQITKSLKLVSAAKLRHVQSKLAGIADFCSKCSDILNQLISRGEGADNPFISPHRENNTVCYVLLLGSRGLCGAYNTALLKYTDSLMAAETRKTFVVAVGHWGRESLAAEGYDLRRRFDDMTDTPGLEDASPLADYLRQIYLSGEADQIEIVYEHYNSALSQTPASKTLLPIAASGVASKRSDYIFEPDRVTLLEKLVRMELDNTVYSLLLEAKKSEHTARMNTMDSACENTDELLEELQMEMNHVRQSQITTELTEIMGGSGAVERK